ncbi:MAG TPA: hypothetical protein VFG21_03295 [Xanthomonadaceae bacterium]|nr:hypothetical protein [Xanthomonadaceae bacterium]
MSALRLAIAAVLAASPVAASAGTFLDVGMENPSVITHPDNYNGTGGQRTVNVCLDPAALPAPDGTPENDDPEQAIRNAVAEFNRNLGVPGNVVDGVSVGVPFGRPDFESVAMHELGHCMGLDHNVLGPSEVFELGGCDGDPETATPSCGSQAARDMRYFTNSFNGIDEAMNLNAGVDTERGSRDDLRGDDVNRHWFRSNGNNPFEVPPATIDRGTYSNLLTALPAGHFFAEAATSFDPCGNPSSDTSTLRSQLPTSAVMFPVLCTNNVVRQTSWDDVTTLRLAQAGNDGDDGTADDYTIQLAYIGKTTTGCDITSQFTSGPGFAFCEVGVTLNSTENNVRITSGTAEFEIAVDWFFNQTDSTGAAGGGPDDIFDDGFE